MWQSGGMGSHGGPNNPWVELMGMVHKERGRQAAAAHGLATADKTTDP